MILESKDTSGRLVTLLLSGLAGPVHIPVTELIDNRKANSAPAQVSTNIVNNQSMTPPKFVFEQMINVLGNVCVSLDLTAQYRNSISEVQQQFGRLYISS